jgi:hypothetical protein
MAASMASRNLRQTCETQLAHRFLDLQNKIGRSPSGKEFRDEYGVAVFGEVCRLYGTWNNAKTHFGIEVIPAGRSSVRGSRTSRRTGRLLDSTALLASLRAWYDVHGSLPARSDAQQNRRAPVLHAAKTYLSAFKADDWGAAMQRAASLLNIYGGRYGLPESARPKRKPSLSTTEALDTVERYRLQAAVAAVTQATKAG